MANLVTELCVPYATPGATYAASITLPGLSIIFVLLRFYTRSLHKNAFGMDDWLMLPALVCILDSPTEYNITNTRPGVGYGYCNGNNPRYRLVAIHLLRSPYLRVDRYTFEGNRVSYTV